MLYERLTKLIEETGKSMNQIETELNYPRNTLQSYKRSNPSAKRLAEIAKYFNVSTDYLLGREENKTENDLTEEENEVIAAFRLDNKDMSLEEQAEYNEAIKEMMAIAKRLLNDDSKWKK
ncbi:helix-turn-helix domain-containing protein [Lactococcus garvieae]|uniref:helix-turn-helix domain-containing protein n=1 Tax=Lactococcus garvieae TaxID=1363 RepID=UPI00254BE523|nr:helix-turn-helix transcriptional regulator [Lactococcus garvieae]